MTTPPGQGGIAVVELAGGECFALVPEVFVPLRPPAGWPRADLQPGRIYTGSVRSRDRIIDECLLCAIPAGESFLGLPTVEFNVHGGPVPPEETLRALERAGACRLSLAGWLALAHRRGRLSEHARRALSALPSAPTPLAAAHLQAQAAWDFSRLLEHPPTGREGAGEPGELQRLLQRKAFGLALLSPPRVAVLGLPNAGKSSLVNALLGENRTIVHPTPGTTRDAVEVLISCRGVPVRMIDTAGFRRGADTSADRIEARSIEVTRLQAGRAALWLWLMEVTRPLAESLPPWHDSRPPEKDTIWVATKCDATPLWEVSQARDIVGGEVLAVSALKREGLERLGEELLERLRIDPSVPLGEPLLLCEAEERRLRERLKAQENQR